MMSITPCCAAFHYSHSDIKTKNCYLHRIELTTRFEEHQNRQRKIYTKNKWVIEEALAPAAVVLASRSTATVHNAKLIESDDGCAPLFFSSLLVCSCSSLICSTDFGAPEAVCVFGPAHVCPNISHSIPMNDDKSSSKIKIVGMTTNDK